MKLFIFIFLLLSVFDTIATNLSPANIWHDKKASYKLTLTLPKVSTNNFAAFLHSQILLPVSFDTGIKAFNLNGKEIPVFYDASKRSILIKGTNKEEEILLYMGYMPKDSFIVPTVDKAANAHLLTLEEVSWWRTAPNFLTFLTDKIKRLKTSNKSSYESFQKQINFYKNGIFILPSSQRIQMKNHFWEIPSRVIANKNYPYRKELYNSRILASEWRIMQSDNLRTLFPDKYLYKYRFINETSNFIRRTNQYKKDWQKHVTTDRVNAVFGQIQKDFIKRNKQEAHYPEQISLITREWDLGGIPVLCYQGNFYSSTPKTYTLKVVTNSLWFLELNGKIVAQHEFDPRTAQDMEKKHTSIQNFSIPAGLTPFKFYYYRNNSTMNLDVKIKEPNGNFTELTEHLLASAIPAKVKQIENISGSLYPIIPRKRLHTIMTGKQSYLYLENLSFPNNTKFSYKNNPLTLSSITPTVLTSYWNKDFSFTYQGKTYNLPAVSQFGKPAITQVVIDFNLETYPVKYLDEAVSFNIKIENSLNSTLPLQFNVKVFDLQKNLLFNETKEIISPLGNKLIYYQIPHSLSSKLPSNFTIKTELFIFGFSFGKKYLTYLNSQNLNQETTLSNNRFISKKDNSSVILNMKRMKLSHLRTWQLAKLLSFLRSDKTLVLGDIDDDNFIKSLTNNQDFTNLKFEPFGIHMQSGLLNTLTILNDTLEKNKYTNIIIFPPLNEIPYLGKELFYKYLSCIYEIANNSSATKKIQLVIPSNASLEYENIFIKQAREYGLEIITKEIRKKLIK